MRRESGGKVPPCAAVGLAAALAGLWGLGWGLPSRERLALLLPDSLRESTEFRVRLAESWKQLYKDLSANRLMPFDYLTKAESLPGGWEMPPPRLLNSFRSYFLRSENADEQKVLSSLSSMRPRELNFRPFSIGYGGAFLYPLGAWYMAASVLGLVRVSADPRPYLNDPELMARVWMVGRLFNAACFALAAAAIAWVGGWPAGLFFLCLPGVAIASHYLNPYGLATGLAALGLGACLRYLEDGHARRLVHAGVAFGLSIGATLSYAFFGLAIPLSVLLRVRDGADLRRGALAAIGGGCAAAAAFMLTNPYLVFQFDTYRDEWAYFGKLPFVFTFAKFGRFVPELLRHNMGVLGTAAVLLALPWALARRAPARRALCAMLFLVGWITLSMKLTDSTHGRHFLPYFAAAALLVSEGVAALGARAPRAAAAFLALVVLECGVTSAGYLYRMHLENSGRSTRLEAGRWINENLPPGATIGFQGLPQPSNLPPFRFDRYTLVLYADGGQLAAVTPPDYLVAGIESPPPESLLPGYRLIKTFVSAGPSWLPTEAWFLANTPFEIYQRR